MWWCDTWLTCLLWFLWYLLTGLASEDSEKEDIFGFVGAEMSKAGIWCVDWIGFEGCFFNSSDPIIIELSFEQKFRKVWWNDYFDKLLFLVLRVSTDFKKLKCVRGCSRAFEPWIGIDWMGSVYLVFIVQIVLPEVWSFELYSLRMVARKRSSRQANKKWDGWGGDARRLSETEICAIMNHFVSLSCDVFGHLLPIPTSTSNIATSKIYI